MDQKIRKERGTALSRDGMENAGFNRRSNWDWSWMYGATLKYWLTYGSYMAHVNKTSSLSITGGLWMLNCIKFGQASPQLQHKPAYIH